MAGAAGVLYGLVFRQIDFFTGFVPGIKAFTAAVLGGIGNIPGAMLGGLVLGEIESMGPTLFLDGLGVPSPNQLKDVDRLHDAGPGADLPPAGHPGRALVEDAGMTAAMASRR